MSPSPDHAADLTHPYSNVGYLYQQQRNRPKALEHLQSRGRHISRYELGRKDRYGERVTRIYPRELTKSPPSRYPTGSPPAQPPYNATTSPLLSALGTTTNTAAQYTSEWTKSLPFFANQPPPTNGISISGSPPIHHSPAGQGGMSSSPPAPGMRPLSHPNHYPSFGGRLQPSPKQSPGRDRRASMYSQYGARTPFQNNPPLPHQPQAHYYNLPDFDLGLTPPPSDGTIPGEHGYFCGFDTICMGGDDASQIAENVLLVGYEGGLEVFRVEKGRMDLVGRLEGLKGSVIGAKILPWASRRDPLASTRPLIVLIIHGPAVDDVSAGSASNSVAVTDEHDGSSNSPSRPASNSGNPAVNSISGYRTTLEVYSLKERKHLSTLYTSPPVPITDPIESPMFQPPPPIGDFVVDAKGKFVVLASGASGEVFVFAPYTKVNTETLGTFRCIGKVWTSVQFRDRGSHSSSSSAADVNSHEEQVPEQYGVPLFSLSDRWLAVAPPSSTTLLPIDGVATTSKSHERPPGLAHHSVPPQPAPTCAVDAPEPDGLLNRLTREGTQVALKGARWATDKGIQAFKSYMGKSAQPNGTANGNYGTDPFIQTQQPYFPPTHGHHQAQPRPESTVISILDLQKLVEAEESKNKNALHPVATLPAALGCSFMSFSPSGLMLMTVSKKGDFQDVWDLKRINHRKARKSSREISSGPHVRQVARFARMTVTNVIDVVWSTPRANRLAVITDKGTVHMFLMPASAFQWPPSRRIRKSDGASKTKSDESNNTPTARPSAVNSAMQALNGTAKPFLNAVRTRSGSSNGSRFPSFSSLGLAPAAGAKSGKAVAAGLGKSIGAATSNIRHAGDNKLTLPPSQSGVKPCSVRWLTGKGHGSIALVAGGILQIYKIQMRPATGKGKSKNATAISKRKIVEFGLMPVRGSMFSPAVIALLQPDEERPHELEPTRDMDIHGEWIPRSLPNRRGRGGIAGVAGGKKSPAPAPLSLAEIETNPPYQPFYTDRRVARFLFAKPAPQDEHQHHSYSEWDQPPMSPMQPSSQNLHVDDGNAWVFGDEVDAVRISTPAQQLYDIGEGEGGDGDEGAVAAAVQNKVVLRDGEEEVEQVVVTTRRRRVRRGEGEEGEEGFFEDDCEVLDFAEDRV
ncbi:uncharacterized protein BDZ99DRAFT_567001 [Mytilinidion resinicola]|uniref:WD40 repeat-like protein n=1 Tax=Mytilinidion resinicola TaxID=574789 RepID=A0A6A6Z353_9PEZI|nr:uncharacterized protein BDZ99DRAFT_567001 [Mytilinidion resinicola]KAF2815103.1 hypothetical protein BDZ99DRAFT_567001 [Mytilinidion resinicola]